MVFICWAGCLSHFEIKDNITDSTAWNTGETGDLSGIDPTKIFTTEAKFTNVSYSTKTIS